MYVVKAIGLNSLANIRTPLSKYVHLPVIATYIVQRHAAILWLAIYPLQYSVL